MPGGNALGRAALGARRDSSSKKRKPASTDSDSEDSDAAVQQHEKRQALAGRKGIAKELARGSLFRKAIKRQITEQKSKHDNHFQELAEVRNSYQVFYVSHILVGHHHD